MFLIFGEGNTWTCGLHPCTTDSSLLEFASNFTSSFVALSICYMQSVWWFRLLQRNFMLCNTSQKKSHKTFPPPISPLKSTIFIAQLFWGLYTFSIIHVDSFHNLPTGICWHLWVFILILWLLFPIMSRWDDVMLLSLINSKTEYKHRLWTSRCSCRCVHLFIYLLFDLWLSLI